MGNQMKCSHSKKTHLNPSKYESSENPLKHYQTIKADQIMQNSVCFVNKEEADHYFSREEIAFYAKTQKNAFSLDDLMISLNHSQMNWREGECLGQGTFGEVILGFNEDNGQLMAVKQIILKSNDPDETLEKIELEIQLLKQLSHENIVKYIGTQKTNKKFLIFLEYVSGGSLSSILKKYGKLKENLVRIYTIQILKGLEYLHRKKVIHRDIKGANVLIDNSGVCKLADFGSSKQINDKKEGTLIGTVNWMPPEVIKQINSGRFADIWSLGCTVIEIATGKPPWTEYAGSNAFATMYQIVNSNKPPKIPDNLSLPAQDFLRNCLQVEPTKRMNVFKLLRHSFITGIAEIVEEIDPRTQEEKRNYLQVIRRNEKNLSLIPERDENLSFSDAIENNKERRNSKGYNNHTGSANMIESDFKASQYYEEDHKKLSPKRLKDSSISCSIIESKNPAISKNGQNQWNTMENSKITKKYTIHLKNIDDINNSEDEKEDDFQENAFIEMQYEFQANPSSSKREYIPHF